MIGVWLRERWGIAQNEAQDPSDYYMPQFDRTLTLNINFDYCGTDSNYSNLSFLASDYSGTGLVSFLPGSLLHYTALMYLLVPFNSLRGIIPRMLKFSPFC